MIFRLLQEIAVASTRADAVATFTGADWIFVDMGPAERERVYAEITDLIREKPH